MEAMRGRFVGGATARGETAGDATRVFEAISHFVGYGFCKSHAAEFARTIYQTAWLKAHYPAHYLAAFLSSQPAGFFPPHVVLEEAKRLGIPVLPPDLNRSEDRFSVERVGSPGRQRWAIRIGLRQVKQVGDELARAILWERRGAAEAQEERPFTSLEDALERLRPQGLTWGAAEALALCGALDGLAPRMDRRRRLWRLHEVWPLLAPAAQSKRRGRGQGKGRSRKATQPADQPQQLSLAWALALTTPNTAPDAPPSSVAPAAGPPSLPALDAEARVALDYALLGMSARPHPMRAYRRALRRSGVRAIAELAEIAEGRVAHVAGWAISAQRPPTAKGMGFLVLEDETGRLPVALPPRLATQLHALARGGHPLIVTGRVERVRWYRNLLAIAIRNEPLGAAERRKLLAAS
jgi:error-prone DNA polymerase